MSDDLIRRRDAIEAIEETDWYHINRDGDLVSEARSDGTALYKAGDVYKALNAVPTIDAVEVEWIPCSERMPKDSGNYLVRFSDEYIEDHSSLDVAEIEIERFDADCESFGYWVDRFDPVSLGFVDSDWVELPIIAWMPLPKPWKGADDE